MGSRNTSFHDGALARVLLAPFKLGFALALGLAGLLLVAWTVDWVFVAYVWPGRVEGLRDLLIRELVAGTVLAGRQGASVAMVTAPANGLYALVFETTGLHEMAQRFARGGSLSIPDTVVRSTWVARHEAIEVAMLGTQLLGLRAGILARFLPLLVLLYAVGAAEGLSQRAIRRAQAARESASLYHRAKYGQVVVLALGGAVVLVWPSPVAWGLYAVVGAVVVGVLAAWQWAFYKKHV
jgi:Domain of unknown function (DUF4400)